MVAAVNVREPGVRGEVAKPPATSQSGKRYHLVQVVGGDRADIMSLWKSQPLVMDHPLFGKIEFRRGHGWQRAEFEFWGFSGVQLLLDADEKGPTRAQETAFLRLRDGEAELRPRCLAAIAVQRAETERPPGPASVSTLSIPALDGHGPGSPGQLWTIWFEYEGEEHWSYGVQSVDDWCTITGFAED